MRDPEVNMADIIPYLQKLKGRFGEPGLKEHFKGFAKAIQFEFTDLGKTYLLSADGQGAASLDEKRSANPDISISTTSDVLAGILDRKVNPMVAYTTRKIKANGPMEDLLKLQKLL